MKPRRLSGRQQLVLEALIAGASLVEAAKAAGTRPDTVSKMLARPHFAKQLEDARRERRERVARKIEGAIPDAIDTLVDIMRNTGARDMDRIRAATALLDRGGIVKGVKVEVSGEVAASSTTPDRLGPAIDGLADALKGIGLTPPTAPDSQPATDPNEEDNEE